MSNDGIDVPWSRWRAVWRVAAILLWTLVLLVPSLVTRLLTARASMAVISLWHRGCCRLVGLDVQSIGDATGERPVMFVANHVSYLDILVLGGLLKARFIAKSDVRSWPVIGLLSGLAGTIFVERRARRSREQRDVIAASLEMGDSLVLFPEGTSSNGSRVLPFKSSLFSVFETDDVAPGAVIQPVTIDYSSFADGRTIEGEGRDLYAWYADMTLAPHLGRVIGLPGAKVRLVWHDILRPAKPADRKKLALQTEQSVAVGLARLRRSEHPHEEGATMASLDAA